MRKGYLVAGIMTLALLLPGGQEGACAIDFKARGLWQVGFGVNVNSLAEKEGDTRLNNPISNDKFKARQRVRLWLDAIVSENLSGALNFEIGHQRWGQASTGAALGADGNIIKLRQAYIDWQIPDTGIQTRMGIQNLTLPQAAGESNILADKSVAGIVTSWQVNENFGITGMWLRPYNDNYTGKNAGYLDNLDLFVLSLPIQTGALKMTPWVMLGMQGRNTFKVPNDHGGYNYVFTGYDGGNLVGSLGSVPFGNVNQPHSTSKTYGELFWGALPLTLDLAPWRFEFEFDYGYAAPMGRYSVEEILHGVHYGTQSASTERQGWLVKALAEYKFDWGVPGIFGWYSSGDDGNLKNGSERLPFLYAQTNFTSMLGDATCLYGGIGGNDRSMSFDGTWGLGLRIKDISFIEGVQHLIRATWIQGTNDPSMVKYAAFLSRGVSDPCIAWQGVPDTLDYYLTRNDNLLEFNLHTVVNIYENLKMGVEFGYVVNMLDKDTWKRPDDTTFSKTDMWVADVVFTYSF